MWTVNYKMKPLETFITFLTVRIISVFLIQTYFVPDEYWQSLEVAHKLTFGYGYLTWEWKKGIRSYIHPLIISGAYKILELLRLDSPEAIIYVPKILQAILSAYSDLCFYKWCGQRKWPIFCMATQWFWIYTGSRTLINTFEASISTIALSKFPWPGSGISDNSTFIWLIGLLFVIRPTAILMWTPICLYHLILTKKSGLNVVLKRYIPIGITILGLSTLIDSICYGKFIVTSYEFLKVNIFENIATQYGSHPWHWYLSNGVPTMLGDHFIPFILGSHKILKNKDIHSNELILLSTIVFTVTIYSFLPHKEYRFILPLLPVFMNISSRFLSQWSINAKTYRLWMVGIAIFIANIAPAWYIGFVHQKGTIDVMKDLREIAQKNNQNSTSFLFLMPCHSTPLYSYLHTNVSTRFLTCNPNFGNITNYVDEQDNFYKNPSAWFMQNYPPSKNLPSHIILFDNLVDSLGDILKKYKPVKRLFHTDFPISPRIGKYIIVNELAFL